MLAGSALVLFYAMVMMVRAMCLIFAMVMMYLLAYIVGKHTQHLHRMVHGAFVEPEPHECGDIDHQQKCYGYLACKFHYLTSVM